MREIVYMFPESQQPSWFHREFPSGYPTSCYQENRVYAKETVFYYELYGPYRELIPTHLAQGHKVIYDCKNEHYLPWDKQWVLDIFKQYPGQGCFVISGTAGIDIPGVEIIATPYWYWILDRLHFEQFGYDSYQPRPQRDLTFFMQISLQRPARDMLFDTLTPVLHKGLYSYRARGIFLPDDHSGSGPWQRYMNFSWLDRTSFTVAVETYFSDCDSSGYNLVKDFRHFISEKTFKPLAAGHPFLLASTQGNLSHVRDLGFETFAELWDESYDTIPDPEKRACAIRDIIEDFDPGLLDNAVVQEKIRYNKQRIFSLELTRRLCDQTIVEPVIHFANA